MANGTVDDEIDQEQDQLSTPSAVVAPPVVAPRQTIVAPPGRSAIQAPIGAPTGLTLPSPDQAAANQAFRRAQYGVANVPLDQAEKAIAAAQRFQAQRGYQRDIADGKSAVDAMVKWGPLMFGSTAGSAAALARVATAAQPEPEKVMNIGGVGYRIPAKGNAVRITPAPDVDRGKAAREIIANQQKIDKLKPEDQATLDALRTRNFQLYRQIQPPIAPSGVASAMPTAPTGPVAAASVPTVTTKAQFDALASGAIYIGKNGKRYRKP